MTSSTSPDRSHPAVQMSDFWPVAAVLPNDFKSAVASLRRPYVPISEADYGRMLARLKELNADFFWWVPEQKLVTIGEADGGYAIMPISTREIQRILGEIPRTLLRLDDPDWHLVGETASKEELRTKLRFAMAEDITAARTLAKSIGEHLVRRRYRRRALG